MGVAQKIRGFEKQIQYSKDLAIFGAGALMGIIPFLNLQNLSKITEIQWIVLIIDATSLAISLANYIYCVSRIYFVKHSVIKENLS